MYSDLRVLRLFQEFRERLSLDLKDIVVATEAGTGPFLYSALGAALAGAERVIAVAPDSVYARHKDIADAIDERVQAWGIPKSCISVVNSREKIPQGIDLFLNLGFLRPLDDCVLSKASPHAVVSYMCEAWEFRPGDLDLQYCKNRNIRVAGVNEDYAGFGVFSSCGQLALKLLFEAGVEVAGCKIGVLSNDPFGDVIERAILANSGSVLRLRSSAALSLHDAVSLDALLVASYSGVENVLDELVFSLSSLRALNPEVKFIQFSGSVDIDSIQQAGFQVYPNEKVWPYRMSRTLSYLGVRPVLALHSLGMKVGELTYRSKSEALDISGEWSSLVQQMA